MSDRFQALRREARDLPYGPLRIELHEEIVREADRLGDERRGFVARWELVEAAELSGYDDRALVAFSWCLGFADRMGESFPYTQSLLWRYKWIARYLPRFPDIPRERIEAIERDAEERYERHGYGLRGLLGVRCRNALDLGDHERADELFQRWSAMPRDELSDCPACDADSVVYVHVVRRQDDEALRLAEPLLAGELSCASIPHETYAHVLAPLARLGRDEEADERQKRGYRMISGNPTFLTSSSQHLAYLVRREDWDGALRTFERHLGWRLATNVPGDRFHHDVAARMLFERLADRGDHPRTLRLPTEFEAYDEGDRYRPSELAAWFAASSDDLARRFDARNGNSHHSAIIELVRAFTRGDDGNGSPK